MGLFDKISDADPSNGGVYFNAGHRYLAEVEKCLVKLSRKGDQLFIAELRVVESDDARLTPGMKASWIVNFKQDASLGNILWFLGACSGIKVEDTARMKKEITKEVAEFAVTEANPMAGKRVRFDVQGVKTKAGKDFSKHCWEPAEGGAAIAAPSAPSVPSIPATPAIFPPVGWMAHPTSPGWFHNGKEVITEVELRSRASN